MIYLTYNDQPSGVYLSQVIDVCNFINNKLGCKIRLVSLISIRGFARNRKKIKQHAPKAIVLPMIPKAQNWKMNRWILILLFFFIGKHNIWCRGFLATNIAFSLKELGWTKKIVFDARGAYKSEFQEYLNKITNITDDISELENLSLLKSDYQLAVSNQLVEYWKTTYNYFPANYSVIPCTLSDNLNSLPNQFELIKLRNELNFNPKDIVFVYSGSSADWQSINLLDTFMLSIMNNNSNIKLLLLSNIDIGDFKITKQFRDRIIQKWVEPTQVSDYLFASDYGILIREASITNSVSSPTKFAEYLHAGLNVIISNGIGDFSEFVSNHNCGVVVTDINRIHNFKLITYDEKIKNNKLAMQFFIKDQFVTQYKKVIDHLN